MSVCRCIKYKNGFCDAFQKVVCDVEKDHNCACIYNTGIEDKPIYSWLMDDGENLMCMTDEMKNLCHWLSSGYTGSDLKKQIVLLKKIYKRMIRVFGLKKRWQRINYFRNYSYDLDHDKTLDVDNDSVSLAILACDIVILQNHGFDAFLMPQWKIPVYAMMKALNYHFDKKMERDYRKTINWYRRYLAAYNHAERIRISDEETILKLKNTYMKYL